MSSRIYLGIDPGLDGGVVALDQHGSIISADIMPTRKLVKGRRVDAKELDVLLSIQYRTDERVIAILEDPGGHAPSAAGLRSMSISFAAAETILVLACTPYHLVAARAWQAEFWKRPKMPKGTKFNTKAAALDAARKIWPEEDWRVGRGRKPHDGLVDAALIAEYGRRKNL